METVRPMDGHIHGLKNSTAREQDYLKAVYQTRDSKGFASAKHVAAWIGVRAGTATAMFKKLARKGFLDYVRYADIALTPKGEAMAIEVIRHHRLLETFLKKILGYSLKDLHADAELLEHVISPEFERRISRLLGNPRTDPHGSPIPGVQGDVRKISGVLLASLEAGREFVIIRLLCRDPDYLRYLEKTGLVPGERGTVLEKKPLREPIVLRHGKGKTESVSYDLAENILVRSSKRGAS